MRSEIKFFWQQVWFLLKVPFLLIMILFRKRKPSDLFTPLNDFFVFIYEAKITFYLILINVIVFIVEIIAINISPTALDQYVFQPSQLLQFNIVPMIVSWFLHANFMHLFGNMVVLFIFGRVVENEFGPKMLFIYLFSAVVSDLFSAVIGGLGGIGASGAIAGLIGVGILLKPFYLTIIGGAPLFIVGWLYILADITGLLSSAQTTTNHFAHMGGYISAALLIFLLSKDKREKMIKGVWMNAISLAVIGIIWLLFFW